VLPSDFCTDMSKFYVAGRGLLCETLHVVRCIIVNRSTGAMCGSRGSCRLNSACLHQLCLLVTICHAVNCNDTPSTEFAATHPSIHRTQRSTTSTPHVVDAQKAVTVDTNFTNTAILNSISLDFLKKNESLVGNVSASAKAVQTADSGLVSIATEGNDAMPVVGQQVLDHVTYLTPTSELPGHVTSTENDSMTTTYKNTTETVAYDDVIVTSSHGVHSNVVTQNTLLTSQLLQQTSANVSFTSAATPTPVWESSLTNVEPETLPHTASSGNDSSDQLITSSVTSSNHTARHLRVLINRGESLPNKKIQVCSLIFRMAFGNTH